MASALSLAHRRRHEFEVAVQLDGRNIDAQRDLIAFMDSAPRDLGGGEERALEQIHTLSGVDPLEAELALADLYAMKKKFEQATEEYQKILKSDPDRVAAYFEIADYYRDRDDSEHMKQAVEGALRIAPFGSPPKLLPRCSPGATEERFGDRRKEPSHFLIFFQASRMKQTEEDRRFARRFAEALPHVTDERNKATPTNCGSPRRDSGWLTETVGRRYSEHPGNRLGPRHLWRDCTLRRI